jgi:hypothetical protein
MKTPRQQLAELLRAHDLTARELSLHAGLSEREVYEHLPHIEQSLGASGEMLRIAPSRCLGCGFGFDQRARHRRPSRCPRCKSERISQPRFSIAAR